LINNDLPVFESVTYLRESLSPCDFLAFTLNVRCRKLQMLILSSYSLLPDAFFPIRRINDTMIHEDSLSPDKKRIKAIISGLPEKYDVILPKPSLSSKKENSFLFVFSQKLFYQKRESSSSFPVIARIASISP
jgi:hypothetical protein